MATEGGVTEPKKLSLHLSSKAYAELAEMSKKHRRSMTELVRLGLGVVRVILDETGQNHKVIVCTADGQPLKEIVLPAL